MINKAPPYIVKSLFVVIEYTVKETTIPNTIITAINTIFGSVNPHMNDTVIDSNNVNNNKHI